MIRTLLKVTRVVALLATAAFALSAFMMSTLSILTGINIGALIMTLILVALSVGSCVLYECVGIFIDD